VVASTMDPLGWLRKHLEAADTDLLRELVLGFVQALTDLDDEVAAFLARPLDAGPYAYVWLGALAVKCREAGRITNEDGAGWNPA
jgi:transposase-like protein